MLILQQLINGLMLGGLYVMVAVAFTLIIGMLNFLNFTIPALFMVAAMMMWATMTGNLPFGNETFASIFGEANLWIPGIFVSILVITIASLISVDAASNDMQQKSTLNKIIERSHASRSLGWRRKSGPVGQQNL